MWRIIMWRIGFLFYQLVQILLGARIKSILFKNNSDWKKSYVLRTNILVRRFVFYRLLPRLTYIFSIFNHILARRIF